MCGIVGALNLINAENFVKQSLDSISYRGIDGSSIITTENACFGHCLHSVVGNSPQPIKKNNFIFGANCEIYNWKQIMQKYSLKANNDAELLFEFLLFKIGTKNLDEIDETILNSILKELDGVFAFFLHNNSKNFTLLARDVLGEKPLWFNYDVKNKQLVFASEAKALLSKQHTGSNKTIEQIPEELNPRKILLFDHSTNKLNFFNQQFFDIERRDVDIDMSEMQNYLVKALDDSVDKRIPEKSLGLLFSGGIDSTLLAFLLKKKNIPFTAYMTVSEGKSEEKIKAEKIAELIGFKLKFAIITKDSIKQILPDVIKLIESANPVKVEVGTTMYCSLKEAQKDGMKVIFSGVGADDVFAGYKRMLMHQGINEDSLSNLRRIYERDLYRDDVLAMESNIELRLPYLDKKLIELALTIPSKYKQTETPKMILRSIAEQLGLPKELLMLKRNAAQYSSGISKLTTKIVKDQGLKFKGELFLKMLGKKNIPLAIMFSSGKDSVYALHIQHRLNYDIKCLVAIDSENKDSFMFHTPTIDLAKQQSESLEIPLILQKTIGEEELELEDLRLALKTAKDDYGIQGVVTGAIYSNYQRTRVEVICDELNLKAYAPLWHMNQEEEMRTLVTQGYEFIMTKVAADGLNSEWLGKPVTSEMVDELVKLNKKNSINIAGEGGEFETFVLDAPLFKKKLIINKSHIVKHDTHSSEFFIDELKID